jgi:hypothetical protein
MRASQQVETSFQLLLRASHEIKRRRTNEDDAASPITRS